MSLALELSTKDKTNLISVDAEEEFEEIVLKARGSLNALGAYYNNFDEIDIEGSKN